MSMSDARQFAELSARVTRLESLVQELADRVEGKDMQEEVLGPVADEVARDGLRSLLKESRGPAPGVVLEAAISDNPIATPGIDYPKPPEDKPLNGGLRDKLAALQGGEAAPARSQADPRDAHHDARRPSEPKK
jgi:hypothetical protein